MDQVPMPRLMAVLNASPDSFSGAVVDPGTVVARAREAVADGASILDVGGQSLRTDQPEISVEEEIARAVPVVEAAQSALGGAVTPDTVGISVDTYRAVVAAAAVQAGAGLVNDPSGLSDPAMVRLAADTGVTIVLTYNRARPKVRLDQGQLVGDPVADGLQFLASKMSDLEAAGVRREQILVDPGPDLGKSPAQTVEVLRHVQRFRELGCPLLLALSRKDFIGALTTTGPLDRSAGLLGALAGLDLGPRDVLRVHEPAQVRDFYVVRAAVEGRVPVDPSLELPRHLRHVPPPT